MATSLFVPEAGRSEQRRRRRLRTEEVKALALKCLSDLVSDFEVSVSCFEMACPDEGCEDKETCILVSVNNASGGDGLGGFGGDGSHQQQHQQRVSMKLRVRRPLDEVQEADVKASISEWQEEQAAEGEREPGDGDPEGSTTCSCCETNEEKQRDGCNCCGWMLLEDGTRFHAESGRTVAVGAWTRHVARAEAGAASSRLPQASSGAVCTAAAVADGGNDADADTGEEAETDILARADAAAPEEEEEVTVRVKNFYGAEWQLKSGLHGGSTVWELKEAISRATGISIAPSSSDATADDYRNNAGEVRVLFQGEQLSSDGATLASLRIGCDGNDSPLFLVRRRRLPSNTTKNAAAAAAAADSP